MVLQAETRRQFYERWERLARPYAGWQISQFHPYLGKRVADIGCGIGQFLPFFENAELYAGLEPDPELRAALLEKICPPRQILAPVPDITDPRCMEALRALKLDTLLCVNVLEHIRDDEAALRHMIQGLSPGGHLCLLVPAHPFLYGTLDRLDEHFRRYSKKALSALCLKAGEGRVSILKCHSMNLPGALGWFFKGRLLKETRQKDENYQWMNRLLPLVAAVEKFIKPPFGMSLVVVARKQ